MTTWPKFSTKISNSSRTIYWLIFLGLLFRILLFPYGTHVSDMSLWKHWGEIMAQSGPAKFYSVSGWCDYLPFYPLILGLMTKLYSLLPFIPYEYWLKLPASLADLGIGWLIFKFFQSQKKLKVGFILSAIFIFNPAIWFNSSLWGQVDSLGTFFVLASLISLFNRRFYLSGFWLGLSLITKPVYLLAFPFIGLLTFKRDSVKALAALIISSIFTVTIFSLPFSSSPWALLIERFQTAANQYPYTSVNAFNFWSLGGHWWQSDSQTLLSLSYQQWGYVIIGIIFSFLFLILNYSAKLPGVIFLIFGIIFSAFFVFSTRMHERHLLPALPFLNLALGYLPQTAPVYLFLSLSYVLNLRFALIWLLQNNHYIFSPGTINLLSLGNVIAVIFLLLLAIVNKKA